MPILKSETSPEQWAEHLRLNREWRKNNLEAQKAARREYNARPEVKAKRREHDASPQARASRTAREADEAYRAERRAIQTALKTVAPEKHASRLASVTKYRTGFTPALTERMLELQGHKCAVCERTFSQKVRRCSDHCHDVGAPRGLLCRQCNLVEGMIKATGLNPSDFGKRLADYLANPPFLWPVKPLGPQC